jgi:hypothetical protein
MNDRFRTSGSELSGKLFMELIIALDSVRREKRGSFAISWMAGRFIGCFIGRARSGPGEEEKLKLLMVGPGGLEPPTKRL